MDGGRRNLSVEEGRTVRERVTMAVTLNKAGTVDWCAGKGL
jgi:hypothetical protein